MSGWTLQFLMNSCPGEPKNLDPSVSFQRVCSDTRKIEPGDLFIALRGDNFNGNKFAAQAIEKGAVAAVIDEPVSKLPALLVRNVRKTYGQLAAAHRKQYDLPLFGVAGSNGKTSCKEMLGSILREQFHTLHSEANFNNDVGVPATLLRLTSQHESAVLELGTNHPGELAPLISMTKPQYGILTGIGREHLEFFGDLEGVVKEEGMLAELLPASGKLFLYGDGSWVKSMTQRSSPSYVTVGFNPGNDWRISEVQIEEGLTRFMIDTPTAHLNGEYCTPLLGKHQAANASLAIAAAAELGLSRTMIQNGLSKCPQPRQRLQWVERRGVNWLNDAYNANADSVKVALETLAQMPCTGRRYAVLGDMAELGEHAESAHREAGAKASGVVSGLVAVGQWAEVTADAAREKGLGNVVVVAGVKESVELLRDWLMPGDVVLLKASRASKLEQIEELY